VGESTGDFYPPILEARNSSDEVGHFAKVLILAEYERNVELVVVRRVKNVERQANINPFFLTISERISSKSGDVDAFVSVDERTAVNLDFWATAEHRQLFGPKRIPAQIVGGRRHTGVEVD
jgi:hypothetical protein